MRIDSRIVDQHVEPRRAAQHLGDQLAGRRLVGEIGLVVAARLQFIRHRGPPRAERASAARRCSRPSPAAAPSPRDAEVEPVMSATFIVPPHSYGEVSRYIRDGGVMPPLVAGL
jgi:hypothetical protein